MLKLIKPLVLMPLLANLIWASGSHHKMEAAKKEVKEAAKPVLHAYKLDASHSSVTFSISHMMVSKVRGAFNTFDGKAHLDADGKLHKLTGTVMTNSIDTRNTKRDNHLKDPDFFNVETFPKMEFESKTVSQKGNDLTIEGTLSMIGKIRPLTLKGTINGPMDDPWGRTLMGVSVTGVIDREDYGMTWNKLLDTGGFVVGNEVTINVDLELVKEQKKE